MVNLNIPVDRITAQARELHFWRTVLTVLAGLLYGVGWVTYKTFAVTWFVLTWCAVAVKVGWVDAKAGKRGPA